MRSRYAALLLLTLPLITCCATRNEIALLRAERRIEELGVHLQHAQEDNAALQGYALELERELILWQRGSAIQAQELSKRWSMCES